MPAPRVGALSYDARLTSDVCLSRTSGLKLYLSLKSRTEPIKTKIIGTEVAHVTCDSDTTFKVKRSKVNLQGTGTYCGGLPHSLFISCTQMSYYCTGKTSYSFVKVASPGE